MSELQLRELIKDSSNEIERLCRYFAYMQQFVVVESEPPTCELDDIGRLVAHTFDGVDILFAEAGVQLGSQVSAGQFLPVLVDSSRFEVALSEILLVVLRLTGQGDSVTVLQSSTQESIEVVVNRAGSSPIVMPNEMRLRMALADANLRTQRMDLKWQADPFRATIQWQRAEPSSLV
jgi:hypothetical protein